jgi:hypothetical protein
LHVLGTPPAFVLSQDQTLREELPQRVVRNLGASSGRKLCRDRRRLRILGLSLVGPGPCAHGPPARGRDGTALNPPGIPTDRSPMYTEGSGAQDGVNSGTAVQAAPQGERLKRRRRTWTHLSAGVRPKSVHAVEFSKTVAPLLGGGPPQGRARVLEPVPGRTDEYSAQHLRHR